MKIVDKLWGREIWLANDKYCGKILELKPGYSSSYHCHKLKQETFYSIKGCFTLVTDKPTLFTPESEPITIYPNTYHSFYAREPCHILEISTTHSEEDVYRKDESHKLSTYCFDLDGVICSDEKGDYFNVKPDTDMIQKINSLWDKGHKIIIYTARGQTTNIDWKQVTINQLAKWGLNYDRLDMNKPEADIYVDDRCINVRDWR